MTGAILQREKINLFQNEISLESLPPGMYFVSLTGQAERFTTKILKQ